MNTNCRWAKARHLAETSLALRNGSWEAGNLRASSLLRRETGLLQLMSAVVPSQPPIAGAKSVPARGRTGLAIPIPSHVFQARSSIPVHLLQTTLLAHGEMQDATSSRGQDFRPGTYPCSRILNLRKPDDLSSAPSSLIFGTT